MKTVLLNMALAALISLFLGSCNFHEDEADPSVPPDTPTDLAASTQSSSSIALSWKSVDEAASYNIYRDTVENGAFSFLDSSTKPEYVDTKCEPSTTYYYKVSALNKNGKESAKSASKSAETNAKSALGTPVIRVTADSETAVTVSWNLVTGAEGYEIYRSTKLNGAESKLGSAGKTATSYIDNRDVKPGTTYWYQVCAVDAGGIPGDKSAPESAKTKGRSPENVPPASVQATPESETSIVIIWEQVDAATEYEIYRADSKEGNYGDPIGKTDKLTYTDNDLLPGRTYYYKIKSLMADGNKSAFSIDASATTKGALGDEDLLPAPEISRTGSGILLSWNMSAGDSVVLVYRNKDGGEYEEYADIWNEIANDPINGQCSYLDCFTDPAVRYAYYLEFQINKSDIWYSTETGKTEQVKGVIDNTPEIPYQEINVDYDQSTGTFSFLPAFPVYPNLGPAVGNGVTGFDFTSGETMWVFTVNDENLTSWNCVSSSEASFTQSDVAEFAGRDFKLQAYPAYERIYEGLQSITYIDILYNNGRYADFYTLTGDIENIRLPSPSP
jgi:fibronectin type 3 domain-containing protein